MIYTHAHNNYIKKCIKKEKKQWIVTEVRCVEEKNKKVILKSFTLGT